MFTIYHFIWLGICAVFLAAAVLVAIAYIPVFVRARRHGRK